MTTLEPLPFGAETPDELLAAYANGSLTEAERAEVERWLAAHPEWRGRGEAYQAIGAAIREQAAASAPPALADLEGLWAGIDAHPQPRPLRPRPAPAAPPPPPPPPAYASTRTAGRRGAPWWLAVAALLLAVVAVGAVVAAATGRGADTAIVPGSTTPASAAADAPAPTAGTQGAPAGLARLQASAKATIDQRTAATSLNATATLDVTGTDLEQVAQTPTIVVTVDGHGDIEFPDRSRLDTATKVDAGLLPLPAEGASEIEIGERRWVSCGGGAYVEQTDTSTAACSALAVGAYFAGPDAGVDLLERAEGDVQNLGTETIDAVETTHYRFTSSFTPEDSVGSVPLVVDAWVGSDDLLRQVQATTDFKLPFDLLGKTQTVPVHLELSFTLGRFGSDVTIDAPS